eukprot:4130775-Pyramimonas_sp.AAC.2
MVTSIRKPNTRSRARREALARQAERERVRTWSQEFKMNKTRSTDLRQGSPADRNAPKSFLCAHLLIDAFRSSYPHQVGRHDSSERLSRYSKGFLTHDIRR